MLEPTFLEYGALGGYVLFSLTALKYMHEDNRRIRDAFDRNTQAFEKFIVAIQGCRFRKS